MSDKRAIKEIDWFGRDVATVDLYNATDVSFGQGWLQKMVDYGDVVIMTAAGYGLKLRGLRNPKTVAEKISRAMSDKKK